MIRVRSEVGRLRRVLVHEPGQEIATMVPATMEPLLFDDILFGQGAREEHRRFCQVMSYMGVEVIDNSAYLAEALGQPEAREWLRARLPEADGPWFDVDHGTLAQSLVHGVRREGKIGVASLEELFLLPPAANWCFQRDPQVVIDDSVLFCHMATEGRRREALLSQTIFRFHPDLRDTPVLFDASMPEDSPPLNLEGGDVLVLSPDVVAVGISVRTDKETVLALAKALARRESGPRWLLGVDLPRRRAYMHLDTVFTPIDHDACLVFPPVILDDGHEGAKVFEIDLHSDSLEIQSAPPLMESIARRGVDLEPISCGGDDLINQQREQWTDGSNALTVAPGVPFLYRRNDATAETLSKKGYRIVSAEDILMGREQVDIEHHDRVCILITCNELSRARGGPHCLTHPLLREE